MQGDAFILAGYEVGMSMRKLKNVIAIMLIGVLLISSSACSNKEETINTDSFWYSCSSFSIPAVKGYSQSYYGGMYADGYYYLTVFGQKLDEKTTGEETYYKLYKIDSDGNCINNVDLPTKCLSPVHQIVVNNKLYCVGTDSSTEFVIDVNTGDIISEENTNEIIYGFYSSTDNYVKLTANSCIRYALDGTETGRVKTGDAFSAFYQRDGKYYLVVDGNKLKFYEMDFENKKRKSAIECDITDYFDFEINRDSIFTDEGVYYMDARSKSFMPITEWNYVDVKPAYKSTLYETNISFGNSKFGKLYAYNDYEIELIIFNNIPADNNKDKKPITIGGYGINSSLAIKWAVYKFNTSQNEYRVFLDDYWHDYSYTTGTDAQSQIAKLIKHFNEGHAPDIYYGTNFDYRYLYNAGLVIDMLPIIEKDPDFKLDDLVPSIKETVTKNGICYQMFSAYYFDGDFGLKKDFSGDDITYKQVDALAQKKGISIRGDMPAAEFADQIIRYSLGDFIDRSTGNHILTIEELRDIVDFSVRNGMPYGTYSNYIADMDTVHNGTYLTCRRTWVGNLYDVYAIESELNDSFVYLGFPSVYGSSHGIQPDGLVAISADTKNPEVCWQIIKCMLSDDVQEIELGEHNNPVINKIIAKYNNIIYSKHGLKYDLSRLIHSYNLVSSISTFLNMIILLNSNLKYLWEYNLYQMKEKILHNHYDLFKFPNSFIVYRMEPSMNYKYKMYNWTNSRAQRKLMIKEKCINSFMISSN